MRGAGIDPLEPHQELLGQAALPHSGVPIDRDEVRPTLGDRATVDAAEQLELGVPTDDRSVQTRYAAARCLLELLDDDERFDGLCLALQLEGAEGLQVERAARSASRSFADHDGPWFGSGLQPGGRIHRVPGHHGLSRPRIGRREDLARVHPDADLQHHIMALHE